MNKITFIHCSDLHLDTPFSGLSRRNQDHSDRQKEATTKSFERIIDHCINREVDFLIIAGDVFDSEDRSIASQISFSRQLTRLAKKSIPAYLVCGNHDPLSEWLKSNELPPNVHRFSSNKIERVKFDRDGRHLADIYGTSFETKVVKDNLASLYEISENPAPISVAALHGTIGAAGSHEVYAPFKKDDIESKGFDYWALGHIHKRQIINEAFPAIVYPGNPQGRDFGETGTKGCVLVEIEEGQKPLIKYIPTQMIRFEEIDVDLTGIESLEDIESLLEKSCESVDDYDEASGYVYRVTLKGRTALNKLLRKPGEIEELIQALNNQWSGDVSFKVFDRIEVRTSPDLDLDEIRGRNDFPSAVLSHIEETQSDGQKMDDLFKEAEEEFNTGIPKNVLLDLSSDTKKQILEETKMALLGYLVKENE